MSKFTLNLFLSTVSLVFVLFSAGPLYGQTYTTVANGNWSNPATWDVNGVPPTVNTIPPGTTINIRHTVGYDTGNPFLNSGEVRIQPFGSSVATLNVPTNINFENQQGGRFYIINASFLQCRFTSCNDGQPYLGNNPGATKNSGSVKNIGGYVELRSANVEVAQDWTNEGGTRLTIDSCITTGQNFSMKNTGTVDTIIRSHISIGWHGSGNFETAVGQISFDRVRVQLAGTSGSFKLDSGTAGGDIDYITLKNHIVPFIGTGEIFASTSVSTSGLNLDAYCISEPSKYIPNGQFVGTQTPNCNLAFFPAACGVAPPTASTVPVSGRVLTANGRGISRAVLTIEGGELTQPIVARTNAFGYYTLEEVPVGHTYVVSVRSKRYVFSNPSRFIQLYDAISDLDFIAEE